MNSKILIILVVAPLVSCGDSPPINDEVGPAPIWKLVSFGAVAENQTDALMEIPFTYQFDLTFEGDLMGFNGFDGCNFYGSQNVSTDGNLIIPINGIDSGTSFCENVQFEAYLTQFDFFFSVISSSHTFQIGDLSLTLESPSGRSLFFRACKETNPNILGTNCVLSTRMPDLTVAKRSTSVNKQALDNE